MNPEILIGAAVYLGIAALACLIIAGWQTVAWLTELADRISYVEQVLEPEILRHELAGLVDELLVDAGATITAGHDHSYTPRPYDQDIAEPYDIAGPWADLPTPEGEQ